MKSKITHFLVLLLLFSIFVLISASAFQSEDSDDIFTKYYQLFQELGFYEQVYQDRNRIQPYTNNPRYWQYKNEPVLLLGGTDQDNLFNHPDIWPFGLESHLDLMVRYGGNYIRNTMSSRDMGNEWAFGKNEDGFYDLNTWNDEYWDRFRNLLEMAYERDIIVQIEIWDRFDFARDPWNLNPFNPKNNINYTSEESTLPEVIETHPIHLENPFFRSTGSQEDNPLLRSFQKAFVDKMLSISLEFPNVLYCISNETNESPHWSDFWAYHLFKRAQGADVLIFVTEMWDAWDLSDPEHDATFDKPDMYRYVDISQNNHQRGEQHWINAQKARNERLSDGKRPMNSVKIYGGRIHGGELLEGAQKFWRNIFGGFATSRFHRSRPFFAYGLGLSVEALYQMKSMRMLEEKINFFEGEPANDLLMNREEDEAYAFSENNGNTAVFFTDGGEVSLSINPDGGTYRLKWLDISNSRWLEADTAGIKSGELMLTAPGGGQWVVVISPNMQVKSQ